MSPIWFIDNAFDKTAISLVVNLSVTYTCLFHNCHHISPIYVIIIFKLVNTLYIFLLLIWLVFGENKWSNDMMYIFVNVDYVACVLNFNGIKTLYETPINCWTCVLIVKVHQVIETDVFPLYNFACSIEKKGLLNVDSNLIFLFFYSICL